MKHLSPLLCRLILSRIPVDNLYRDCKFEGYDITDYDFENNLCFDAKQAGTYIFTKREMSSQVGQGHENKILYIGETEDLSTRFYNHEKKMQLKKYHCNTIFVCKMGNKEEALKLQNYLLGLYPTPINNQLSPTDDVISEKDYSPLYEPLQGRYESQDDNH